jgi:hypothetical protein
MPNKLKELREQGKQLAAIRHARGILKRKAGDRPLASEWAEHKKVDRDLEGRIQKPVK